MDDEQMLAEKISLISNNEVVFDKNELSIYAKNNYSQEILMDKLLKLYEEIREK